MDSTTTTNNEWDQQEEQKVDDDDVVTPVSPRITATKEIVKTEIHMEPKASAPPTASSVTTSAAPGDVPATASFAALYFNTENNGELYMRWSDAAPSGGGALAQFWTTHKIPAFKFKKSLELTRNIGGSRKKFYEGLASFVKEADANEGHLTVLDASDTGFGDVWVSVGGKKWGKEAGVPRKIALGETVDVNAIEALVILPRACAVFEGILKIDLGKFVNTGLREGAAWQRH